MSIPDHVQDVLELLREEENYAVKIVWSVGSPEGAIYLLNIEHDYILMKDFGISKGVKFFLPAGSGYVNIENKKSIDEMLVALSAFFYDRELGEF